ncbi:hypothetical protein ICU_02385 [Bacillus cereus BAG2X1-1]|nr:hypothetical protein ICU_02385 [Bacillus cereus BAG2X1-1]
MKNRSIKTKTESEHPKILNNDVWKYESFYKYQPLFSYKTLYNFLSHLFKR